MRHQVGFLDLQRIHHAGDVERLVLLGIAAIGMRRQAHAAQVRHNHGVILHQLYRGRRPHVAGIGEAVQQHDRGSLSADAHIKLGAVCLNRLGLEASRKRDHARGGRSGE